MSVELMTEAEVVALLGAERFAKLRNGKPYPYLSPSLRVKGFEGQPMYPRHYVELRLAEDRGLLGGAAGRADRKRLPAVVTKAARPADLPRVVTKGMGTRPAELPAQRVVSMPDEIGDGMGFSICAECGGSGECPGCDGAGEASGNPCKLCGGSGECVECDGKGKRRERELSAEMRAALRQLDAGNRKLNELARRRDRR